MIEIAVNGTRYTDFTKVSFVDTCENLCNQFTVLCTAKQGFQFPIKRGASCSISIDGTQVFTGWVEKISGQSKSGEYSINFQGRDRTRDILKAGLPPGFSLKGPIALKAVIEKALKACGLNFKVIDESGGIESFSSKEVVTEGVGAKLWDFLIPLAQKRQVLLSKNSDGDIVILRPNQNIYSVTLYNLIDDLRGQNNIVEVESADFDDSERYHKYVVSSQVNFSVPRTAAEYPAPDPAMVSQVDPFAEFDHVQDMQQESDWTTSQSTYVNTATLDEAAHFEDLIQESDPDSEVTRVSNEQLTAALAGKPSAKVPKSTRTSTRGEAIDNAVPVGSTLYEAAEHPADDEECLKLAKWKCNVARAKSFNYSVRLAQHMVDDKPWRSGWLIPVVDEIWDIDATLMIRSVEYSEGTSSEGNAESYVKLTLGIPDAFTDAATAPSSLVQVNNIGENWNSTEFS